MQRIECQPRRCAALHISVPARGLTSYWVRKLNLTETERDESWGQE